AMDVLRVEDSLRRELWGTMRAGARLDASEMKVQFERAAQQPVTLAERRLLELIFAVPEVGRAILAQIESSDYEALATAPIFRALSERLARGETIEAAAVADLLADDPVAQKIVPLVAA